MNSEKDNAQASGGGDVTGAGPQDETLAAAPGPAAAGELEEALREKDQFKRLLQRVQADFINYRNRTEEELEQARRAVVRRFATRVLEVMDLFDSALSQAMTSGVDNNWVGGVRAIQRSLGAALGSEGIERIKVQGEQFDPRRHEALISTAAADRPAGTVLRELRPGYSRGSEVIRPAQVEVAVAPPDDVTQGGPAGGRQTQ